MKSNDENILKSYKTLKQFNDLVKKEGITNMNELENNQFRNKVKLPRQKVVREFDLVRSLLPLEHGKHLELLYSNREISNLYYKVYEYINNYYDINRTEDNDFRLNMAKLSLLLGFGSRLVTQFEELEGFFEEKAREVVADEDLNLKNNAQNNKVLRLRKK